MKANFYFIACMMLFAAVCGCNNPQPADNKDSAVAEVQGESQTKEIQASKSQLDESQFMKNLESGVYEAMSDDEVMSELVKFADGGDMEAQFYLGMMYAHGKFRSEPNFVEAHKWLLKAAEQGNAAAQGFVAADYECGRGVETNEIEAVKWYRKSAEQGLASAQLALGRCYLNGCGVGTNREEAVKWTRKAADQGFDLAQEDLISIELEGCDTDEERFAKMSELANEGYAVAQREFGRMFNKGYGVVQNCSLAMAWYRKAAEQGDAEAQLFLGTHYLAGLGCKQNMNEAVRWFTLSAEQGDSSAQYTLGLIYKNGSGTGIVDNAIEANMKEAVKYLRMAAESGHEDAQRILEKMEESGELPKAER